MLTSSRSAATLATLQFQMKKPKRKLCKILALDPSVNEVGWAVVTGMWRDEDGVWHDENAEWKWGMWKLSALSYTFKLHELREYIDLWLGGLEEGDLFVGEWPAFFDNMRGNVAAKKGYTIDLAGILCYIMGYYRLPWQSICLLTAAQWKGNLPKEITKMRFFKALGVQAYKVDHNAVDACMLLWEFCKRRKITMKITPAVDQLTVAD